MKTGLVISTVMMETTMLIVTLMEASFAMMESKVMVCAIALIALVRIPMIHAWYLAVISMLL